MTEQTQESPTVSNSGVGIDHISHIIAIASGKGGVGKSTVSVNLAVALQSFGARVGLMDADIYGPSQPGMLGSQQAKVDVGDNFLHPVVRYGIQFISMGLLVADDGPVIWRAPIAMKMIHQFLGSVAWGELDYLLIDLPPGTGDVQLTLAQQAKLSGAVIVTTPQEVAIGVARRGLRMFEQVNVPILGIVENMSGFTCKHCGEETAIFDQGGGKQMAEQMKVPFLGSLPLDPEIMMSGDSGVPILTNGTDTIAAKAVLEIAAKVRDNAKAADAETTQNEPRSCELDGKDRLNIVWPDDHRSVYSAYQLRLACQCASCIDENSGRKILDSGSVPLDISIKSANPVGRYGMSFVFSDGHSTGIYAYTRLRELCECDNCRNGEAEADRSFSV